MNEPVKKKYLYGASVEGIQNFIFQTDELKGIINASDIIETICSESFFKQIFDSENNSSNELIMSAAGKILFLFYSESDCKKVVKYFPFKVLQKAPNIEICQAVVEIDNVSSEFKCKKKILDDLLKAQRNRRFRSQTMGLMAMKRSSKTGLPIDLNKKDASSVDLGLTKKFVGSDDVKLCDDLDYMCNDKSWIAVIHADGNGLGNILKGLEEGSTDAEYKKALKKFSEKLNEKTEKAAKDTFNEFKKFINSKNEIQLRPVILGGDDLTIICNADIGIDFASEFLKNFEKYTKDILPGNIKNGLTACAGVVFIKKKYPIHYAVDLAESLCRKAKNEAKVMGKSSPSSCLMFHKVQDSFSVDFGLIEEKELTPCKGRGYNLSFVNGPYFLGALKIENTEENENKIVDLENGVDILRDNNALKSGLRQWLGCLYDNPQKANQLMRRLMDNYGEDCKGLHLGKYSQLNEFEDIIVKIPFYDMLALLSVESDNKKKRK